MVGGKEGDKEGDGRSTHFIHSHTHTHSLDPAQDGHKGRGERTYLLRLSKDYV